MRSVARAVTLVAGALFGASCSLFVDASGLSTASEVDGSAPPVDAGTVAPDGAIATPPDAADAAKDPTLLGEWHFDDIGGTLSPDTSGYGHPALLKGAARIAAGGVRGGALALAGGADVAVVSALDGAAFPATGTLSLWVRYTFNPGDGQNRAIFDDWDKSRSHMFLRRPDGQTNGKSMQIAFQPASAAGTYVAAESFVLEPSTWVHVVVTWDAATKEEVLYTDGRQVASGVYNGPYAPTNQAFVLGTNWVGQMDEVRLFGRVLSAVDVAKLD